MHRTSNAICHLLAWVKRNSMHLVVGPLLHPACQTAADVRPFSVSARTPLAYFASPEPPPLTPIAACALRAAVCGIALRAAEMVYSSAFHTAKLRAMLRYRRVVRPTGALAGGRKPAVPPGGQAQQGAKQQGGGQPIQQQQQQCGAERQGRAQDAQKRKASAAGSGEKSSEGEQQVLAPRRRMSAPHAHRSEGSGGSPQLQGAAGSTQGGHSSPSFGRCRSVERAPRQQHAPSPRASMTSDRQGLLEGQVGAHPCSGLLRPFT
jgi:hypothetical protein